MHQQALLDNKEREERFQFENKKKQAKKRKVMASVIVLLLLLGSWIAYEKLSPGKYDSFAKCLTEKGAVMYGEDWCPYTQGQKTMFGKSFKYVDYHEFPELPGIKKTPTWVINGKWYENAQSFEKLSEVTGCKI